MSAVSALTPPDVYQIYTEDDLKAMNDDNDIFRTNYFLMNDIEITASVWTPIGSSDKPFTNSFLGNNYTITFTEDVIFRQPVNTNDTGYGFFGNVHHLAEIRDFTLVFQGNVTSEGFDNTGALVGHADAPSLFFNCVVQSQGHSIFGGSNVGGLAGHLANNSKIVECSSDFSVIAEKDYAGGLVGYISSSVVIENSSANGSVTPPGKFGNFIGGWDEKYKPEVINCFYQGEKVDLTDPIPKEDQINYGRFLIILANLVIFKAAILAIVVIVFKKKKK
jgi:hypothetical protein